MLLSVFGLVSLLSGSALAHLQMMDPLPIRSPLNPAVPNDSKDYSYTAPLISNGLPYPCKGYLDSESSLKSSQKSWAAGTTQSFTIAPPGAVHGGGSCQLSLSYDMGKTWNVIFSYIGGCMAEDLTNSFVIPKAAPSGEAVFSWTWFNRLGNREMYQNCAIVTVTGGGSGLNSRDHPAPFVANAGPVNTCSTIENQDVVFPNPGATVKYSGEYRGTTPAANRGVTGNSCAHPGGADGAGTRGGSGGGGGGGGTPPAPVVSVSLGVHLIATESASTTSANAPAATVTPSPTPSPSSTSAAAAATTSVKGKTCRRRRSVAKRSAVLIQADAGSEGPAVELKSHRERKRRARHIGWESRQMALEPRTQRVAAMQAEKPKSKD